VLWLRNAAPRDSGLDKMMSQRIGAGVVYTAYCRKPFSLEEKSTVSMLRFLKKARTASSSWTSRIRGRSHPSKSRILVGMSSCFSTSVSPCRKAYTNVCVAISNARVSRILTALCWPRLPKRCLSSISRWTVVPNVGGCVPQVIELQPISRITPFS